MKSQSVLTVPDISCEHCVRAVTNALSPLPGVENVAVDIPTKKVTVDFESDQVDVEKFYDVLAEEDYPVSASQTASV